MATHSTVHPSLADAKPVSYWLDHPERPSPLPTLDADTETELAIVGGGFTGLWAAIRAKEADPSRDVLLIEAERISEGASGRNMGALWDDIAGGPSHALAHFPHEYQTLRKLGRENTDGLLATLERYGIDAAFEKSGILYVARHPDLAEALRASCEALAQKSTEEEPLEYLDRETLQADIHSPVFFGAIKLAAGRGVLDPARLSWGLRDAAIQLGVRIHEGTPMTRLSTRGAQVELRCPRARVRAHQVVLATNAYRSAVRYLRRRIAPMWGWVLMTEPLSIDQMKSIGWSSRVGLGGSDISGSDNPYHYYRITQDDRILIGSGSEYVYGGSTKAALGDNPGKHDQIAEIFFESFPQLGGLRFTHRWGGVMGMTTTRVTAFGSTANGRVAWAAAHNGHGINGSRFGANVALAMLGIGNTDVLKLDFIRKVPQAWPPEPVRYLGIHATLRAMDAAQRSGRPGLWLRLLTRLGMNVGGAGH